MNQELKQQIEQILTELYEADKELKNYHNELEKAVEKLILAKPEAEVDEEFKSRLKNQLLVKAEELKAQKASKTSLFSWLTYTFAGTSAALLLVLAGGIFYLNEKGYFNRELPMAGEKDFGVFAVDQSEERAFGSLSSDQQQGVGAGSISASDSESGAPKGSTEFLGTDGAGVGGASVDARYIRPSYYSFVYEGEDFNLDKEKVRVLKRQKNVGFSGLFDSLLKNLDLGLVNLENFTNMDVKTISLEEDKDFGYSVFINFREGMLSLNSNWRNWIQPMDCGGDQDCASQTLEKEDLPEENELIKVAEKFVSKYGIDVSAYDEPKLTVDYDILRVQKSSDNSPEISEKVYIPNNLRVVYPLKINSKNVYNSNGDKEGLIVMIDVRMMRVVGLYNLTTLKYSASPYEAETNVDRILKIAEQGGVNQGHYYEEGKIKEISIGSPEFAYLKHHTYQNHEANELLVPALVFPVDQSKSENFYRKAVVVPLAEELLEDNNNPRPEPMPVGSKDTDK